MDQNRDGFIDKNDLRDTFAALGKLTSPAFIVSWLLFFFVVVGVVAEKQTNQSDIVIILLLSPLVV